LGWKAGRSNDPDPLVIIVGGKREAVKGLLVAGGQLRRPALRLIKNQLDKIRILLPLYAVSLITGK
jgi:hypothetical protein